MKSFESLWEQTSLSRPQQNKTPSQERLTSAANEETYGKDEENSQPRTLHYLRELEKGLMFTVKFNLGEKEKSLSALNELRKEIDILEGKEQ